jgi:prefoldin subunit 5
MGKVVTSTDRFYKRRCKELEAEIEKLRAALKRVHSILDDCSSNDFEEAIWEARMTAQKALYGEDDGRE